MKRTSPLLTFIFSLAVAASVQTNTTDPYKDLSTHGSVQDTADEPFIRAFSAEAAAGYLDRRAHLVEHDCYACHSTFTYLPARSTIDPLAPEVMRTRVMLERIMTMLLDPAQVPKVKTQHISRIRILAPVELARHDAITTGTLAPLTRQSLDAMWKLQKPDGGIAWIHVKEAPQAIDDWWPVAMMALGAGTAPEHYVDSEPAKAGVEKLRAWFRAHPPQNNHERGLTLIAHSAIGGIVSDDSLGGHVGAIFSAQHEDGGWSIAELADWQRPDKRPLDPSRTDGYATGFLTFVLARNGVAPQDSRLRMAVEWLKQNQRETGGWFTPSPFKRDILASNTGTSFAVQALATCGEIEKPQVTTEQFATAHAAAEGSMQPSDYLPNQTAKATAASTP